MKRATPTRVGVRCRFCAGSATRGGTGSIGRRLGPLVGEERVQRLGVVRRPAVGWDHLRPGARPLELIVVAVPRWRAEPGHQVEHPWIPVTSGTHGPPAGTSGPRG